MEVQRGGLMSALEGNASWSLEEDGGTRVGTPRSGVGRRGRLRPRRTWLEEVEEEMARIGLGDWEDPAY